MNREELKMDAAVVEGMFSTHGYLVPALIDPSSMHSFVNEAHAYQLN
jgi:hypothetical protein